MQALLSLFLVAQAVVSVAHAECNALLAALERADQEPRVAHYAVESKEQPLTGTPVFVRVGNAVYYDLGTDFKRVETDSTSSVLQSLRNSVEQDMARCSTAGSDIYRGESVKKFSVFDTTAATDQKSRTIFWIDERSGLPVYQQSDGAGRSVAWIYGDVDEPETKSLSAGSPGGSASSDIGKTAGEIADLENAFWLCDYAGSKAALNGMEEALCSAISDDLRQVKFGGDFEKLLTWWQQHKTAKHLEQERAIASAARASRRAVPSEQAVLPSPAWMPSL